MGKEIVNENSSKPKMRKKRQIIEEAISCCTGKSMFNKFKICEQVAETMVNKYSGKNLDYHSRRMGLDTNQKILKEIDEYFYKNLQVEKSLNNTDF